VADATTIEWKRVAGERGPEPADGKTIWETLADRINPALDRPTQSPDVAAIPLTSPQGRPYFILTNRSRNKYLRLGPEDYYVWSLLDGAHSVTDLVVEYFTKFGTLAFGFVAEFVTHLRYAHMLAERPSNVYSEVRHALNANQWEAFTRLVWQVMTGQRKLVIRRVDTFLSWIHDKGGWLLYTWPIQLLYLALCGYGGWLFLQHMRDPQFGILPDPKVAGSAAMGVLALAALNYGCIAIHEFAHALTCKHHGARVNGAGAMLYFGMPAFYIDTTDIWTRPAPARIATSWAGPYSGLILAGVLSILIQFNPGWPVNTTLHRIAFLWIYILCFNLIPLLELDGYYMLIDWLDFPMLRARSLAFVRKELWAKLRLRERLTGEQRLLASFGILAVVFSAAIALVGVSVYRQRFSSVILELWNGGIGQRLVLLFVVLVFAVPLVVGISSHVVLAGQRAVSWTRTQWRQPRRWTLRERRGLLQQVRFLAPLAADQLSEVATRLQRSTYRPGEAVIRQGETGDRFYIIERGTAEVFVGEDTAPRVNLEPGDYFGELALLRKTPRTATVRAATPLSVLWLTKGDFERLLAAHVAESAQVDQAIYALDRLRGIAIFASLSARDLDELAAKLEREQFPAGAAVVEEGAHGDAFYLIDSGQAEVTIKGHRVRTMGRGDHFGEIALLQDVPRTATVRALTPLDVLKLHRPDFEALVRTALAQVAGMLETVAQERLLDSGVKPA